MVTESGKKCSNTNFHIRFWANANITHKTIQLCERNIVNENLKRDIEMSRATKSAKLGEFE